MSLFTDGNKAKKQHINLKRQIKQLPEDQQEMLEKTSRIVEETMLAVEEGIWSGESFKLHDQMKNFFASHGLFDSDEQREVLGEIVQRTKPGRYFIFQDVVFRRTEDSQIVKIEDYIYTLEKSIMTKESIENICTFVTIGGIFKMLLTKIRIKFLGVRNGKK